MSNVLIDAPTTAGAIVFEKRSAQPAVGKEGVQKAQSTAAQRALNGVAV
jgi:hypothetical protein